VQCCAFNRRGRSASTGRSICFLVESGTACLSAVMNLDMEWRSRNSRAEQTWRLVFCCPAQLGDDALDKVRPGHGAKSRDPSALFRGICNISRGHLAEGNICIAPGSISRFHDADIAWRMGGSASEITVSLVRRRSTSWYLTCPACRSSSHQTHGEATHTSRVEYIAVLKPM
jgi:hypothetical protein